MANGNGSATVQVCTVYINYGRYTLYSLLLQGQATIEMLILHCLYSKLGIPSILSTTDLIHTTLEKACTMHAAILPLLLHT